MTYLLRQSTTGQSLPFGPFLSDTDGKTPQTALTIANTDIMIWKHSAVTEVNKNSGGATHMNAGRYYAVFDETDTNSVGNIEINVHVAGALPVKVRARVLPAEVYDATVSGTDYATLSGIVGAVGGGVTQSLNVQPIIPQNIDLADTATVRIGLILTNAVDDLPSTAEITPGTISIERKGYGGTSWIAVVTDEAMSEQDGMVYYDEVFDSGSGYTLNDSIRIIFKSVSITADANTFEVVGAGGALFQTSIRQQHPQNHHLQNISGAGEARIDETSAELVRQILEDPVDSALLLLIAGIESRTVAGLVNGRVPVTVEALDDDTDSVAKLKEHALRAVPVTFAAGGTTTTAVLATVDGNAPNGASDLIYKNAALVFSAPAALKDQRALIQSYDSATNTVTITQVAAAVGDTAVAVLV